MSTGEGEDKSLLSAVVRIGHFLPSYVFDMGGTTFSLLLTIQKKNEKKVRHIFSPNDGCKQLLTG